MTPPGDEARASVRVDRPAPEVWRLFTEEIDRWWRRGPQYRAGTGAGIGAGTRAGARAGLAAGRSVLRLEPFVGGRLIEALDGLPDGPAVVTGTVTVWEPPRRLVFEWRAANFAAGERTEVEVRFEPGEAGTMVSVVHRGWAAIRADHPVRHGRDALAHQRAMATWWGALLAALRQAAG